MAAVRPLRGGVYRWEVLVFKKKKYYFHSDNDNLSDLIYIPRDRWYIIAAMLAQRSSIGCTARCNCFPAATPLSIRSRVPLYIRTVYILCVCVFVSSPTARTHPTTHSYIYGRPCNNNREEGKKLYAHDYIRYGERKKHAEDKGPSDNPNIYVQSAAIYYTHHIYIYIRHPYAECTHIRERRQFKT